jgi:hypothetical protein
MADIDDLNDPLSELPMIFTNNSGQMDRMNTALDKLTEKRFLSPTLFAATVRACCDFMGISLPHLPIEGMDGPNVMDGKAILQGQTSATSPSVTSPPTECEYLFKIIDADAIGDEISGITPEEDWDGHLYLYIVMNRDDEGLYEAWAQVIDEDDLDDLAYLDVYDRDYPELVGDVNGETQYLKQTRHAVLSDKVENGA